MVMSSVYVLVLYALKLHKEMQNNQVDQVLI